MPCPHAAPVDAHSQCPACSGLERPDCIFEPRCMDDPSHCACPFGPVPHVVYAAYHGTLPKVGMTQERRVRTRLREQGADAYLVLARPPDRATARSLERRIAALHRIPEWRTHKEVLPQLARPVPWTQIEARAEALRQRLLGVEAEPGLHRITDHRLPQPLPSPPRRAQTPGDHEGTWMGIKGPHLIYAQAPSRRLLDVGGSRPLAALHAPDLVGRLLCIHP